MCDRDPCRCWSDVELVRWRLLMRDVLPGLRALGWLWVGYRSVASA
jgi:hypothetical protein